MAGIYIHIPYCKTRCIYCDFYKETNEENMGAFVSALCSEIALRKDEIKENIKTIYFGGGTPSRLRIEHFDDIFTSIYSNYSVDKDAEITVETNPDDLSPGYVSLLRKTPVNRLSIGIQSFDDKELKFLSRRHSSQQAIDAVKLCQEHGFDNISIDLIYGIPNQTIEVWESNLKKASNLNVQHIPAYHLIYEEDTKLYTLLERGKVNPVEDELSVDMFSMLISKLADSGFEQYEVCSFSRDGLYSRHNSSYWHDEKYIGFGPSAHSYDGDSRSWNMASLGKYILAINEGKILKEAEILSEYEKYNEYVLTKLRMMKGMSISDLRNKFGDILTEYLLSVSQNNIDKGLILYENDILKLSQSGIFMSDDVISEMMWVD